MFFSGNTKAIDNFKSFEYYSSIRENFNEKHERKQHKPGNPIYN